MRRNLDLAGLRSFVAVAETGGVTRAAKRLHLTQSAVSMQLKRLEASIGVELLARVGRGVALTPRGEVLLAQARRLLALNDEIWEAMTTAEVEGELTIGIPHDIVYPLAPMVLRRFSRERPGVRLNLISQLSTDLHQQLADGLCDVIVTTEFNLEPGGETLSRRPLVWVGAPGGRAWRRKPAPIAIAQRCAFRKCAFEALDAAGIGWDWTISTASDDAVTATIAADLAIAPLLAGTCPRELEEIDHGGDLPALPEMRINMFLRAGDDRDLIERVAAHVRTAQAEIEPSASALRLSTAC